MRLGQRVAELERQAGVNDTSMLLLVRKIVSVDNARMGAERVIHHDPIGLKSMREDRRWPRNPGESVEALRARVQAELHAEGHKVYKVCEVYRSEEADSDGEAQR